MSTTRFAPSTTGYLHLGHVLHLLYVWGLAQARGAKVVVRMEDHDRARTRPEYEPAILADLRWLGFEPDRGLVASAPSGPSLYRQSDCAEQYATVLSRLAEQGRVYGCDCSRREIAARQGARVGESCYRGVCADKGLPLEGHTVRFRVAPGTVAFRDGARGSFTQVPAEQCGDFSLRDRHGQWTYQFCCVCDDIRHGVDLVIRGEDLLASTGRQIRLFEALGHAPPAWYHHRLLCDDQGRKLSKRFRSESITSLREAGVAVEVVFGRVAAAAGLIETPRPLDRVEALERLAVRERFGEM